MRIGIFVVAIGAISSASHANEESPAAALFEKAVACQKLTDSQQRLACYDTAIKAMDEAHRSNQIAIVDRENVKKLKKSLFGFTLPRLSLFSGNGQDTEEIKELEGKIKTVQEDREGYWIFLLEDGGRWHQIDQNQLGKRPRPGDAVIIRRGALGSFKMSVANQPGIKVKREN